MEGEIGLATRLVKAMQTLLPVLTVGSATDSPGEIAPHGHTHYQGFTPSVWPSFGIPVLVGQRKDRQNAWAGGGDACQGNP